MSRMSQLMDKPSAPSESSSRAPARRRAASTSGTAGEQYRAEVIQNIAADREALQRMQAEEAAQAQAVAEMNARLEALKQKGIQLVKQLKRAKAAAAEHSQAVSQLRERISTAEKQLKGANAAPAMPKIATNQADRLGTSQVKGHRQEGPTPETGSDFNRPNAVTVPAPPAPNKPGSTGSAASPANPVGATLHSTPHSRAPTPAADSASDEQGYFEDNPLIAQLLHYQARQSQAERGRRIAVSLAVFLTMVAAIAGFYFLIRTMLGYPPL